MVYLTRYLQMEKGFITLHLRLNQSDCFLFTVIVNVEFKQFRAAAMGEPCKYVMVRGQPMLFYQIASSSLSTSAS